MIQCCLSFIIVYCIFRGFDCFDIFYRKLIEFFSPFLENIYLCEIFCTFIIFIFSSFIFFKLLQVILMILQTLLILDDSDWCLQLIDSPGISVLSISNIYFSSGSVIPQQRFEDSRSYCKMMPVYQNLTNKLSLWS